MTTAWNVPLQVDWAAVPTAGWGALLWAAWGASFAAHSGICWAVGRCAAVIPSIYGCLQVWCALQILASQALALQFTQRHLLGNRSLRLFHLLDNSINRLLAGTVCPGFLSARELLCCEHHACPCYAVDCCAAVVPSIYGCLQVCHTAGLAETVLGRIPCHHLTGLMQLFCDSLWLSRSILCSRC